ncbi:MAG: hypothetical protein JNL39_15100, partial [Opitutaceae bacterium]|nr:hypothetical protein [Opitutaceae bacterium]
MRPPLLPAEVLARVVRVARFDGLSVLVLAGTFALLKAIDQQAAFAVIGLAAAGAGALELHGVNQLGHADTRGVRWLLASQPILLAAVLAYCALRLKSPDVPPIPEALRSLVAFSAGQLGLSVEAYLRFVQQITISVLAIVSAAVQGGMFLYYWRRRSAIQQA